MEVRDESLEIDRLAEHQNFAISRRGFLRLFLASGAAIALGGLPGCAGNPPPPSPVVVTRIVEATRIVEKVVEVDTTPKPLLQEEEKLIWYVDIEHEKALADEARAPEFERVRKFRAWVCGEAANANCEPVLYQDISWDLVNEKNVQAICISGNTTDWEAYDFATFAPLFEIVKSGKLPVIGFCGGHQLIGLMYEVECGPLRRLKPGEEDPAEWAPGWYKEVGYKPVQVVKEDPLFDSLGNSPEFFESHYWEIKELPPEFDLLASTSDCRIQAIKHKSYPIYGTQFHPEVNDAGHMDGRTLLINFFRSTGIRQD